MLYFSARVITPLLEIPDGAVLVENDVIRAVGSRATLPPPTGAHQFNLPEFMLAPGFIDLQLNGGFGSDFTTEPATIWRVAEQLPQYGVTSFLPTIISSPFDTIKCARDVLRTGAPKNFRGATPLGLHLEGPFLNPAKHGAHNPSHLQPPSLDAIRDWSAEQQVRLVTLAPELQGALNVVRELHARGVVVSAGHSMATYAEAKAGFDAGITYGTHLFNAMPHVEARAPNLPGALLADPRVTVGIIPDGLHVHPALVGLAYQAKGAARLNLVTDAMAALGMPPGEYPIGDQIAHVDATSARLANGRLAGSILNLEQALKNFCEFTTATRAHAIETMTLTPAQLLGETTRGQIVAGARADFVLLSPEGHVAATFVGGELVWGQVP